MRKLALVLIAAWLCGSVSANDSIELLLPGAFKTTSFPEYGVKQALPADVPPGLSDELAAWPDDEEIAIKLQLPDVGEVTGWIQRFDLFTPDLITQTVDPNGTANAAPPNLQFYRGRLSGDEGSWIQFCLGPNLLAGMAGFWDRQYRFGPAEFTSRQEAVPHLIFNILDVEPARHKNRELCLVDRHPETWPDAASIIPSLENGAPTLPDQSSQPLKRRGDFTLVDLALEGDFDLSSRFNHDESAVFAYFADLVNLINAIYHRDLGVELRISFQRVWKTTGGNYPYQSSAPSVLLGQIRSFWLANMGHVKRNLAHLVSGKGMLGGIAYIHALCDLSRGYGVSTVFGTTNLSIGEGLWDLYVTAHEIAHGHGGQHTHCYNPPIDRCYTSENGCATGPQQCGRGTLMSYCFNCGGLGNMDYRFHARVIEAIAGLMAQNACLQSTGCSLAVFLGEDIEVPPGFPVKLSADVSGAQGSLTFAWSPAPAFNNSGSSTPRVRVNSNTSLTLVVTDSATCSGQATMNLIVRAPAQFLATWRDPQSYQPHLDVFRNGRIDVRDMIEIFLPQP